MNVPDVFNTGPHQYRIFRHKESNPPEYGVSYCLFGCNGTMEVPIAGKPNSQGWRNSSKRFDSVSAATIYAQRLLRDQDREND